MKSQKRKNFQRGSDRLNLTRASTELSANGQQSLFFKPNRSPINSSAGLWDFDEEFQRIPFRARNSLNPSRGELAFR